MDRVNPKPCPMAFFTVDCKTIFRGFNQALTKMAAYKLLIDFFEMFRRPVIVKLFLALYVSEPGQLEGRIFDKQYPPVGGHRSIEHMMIFKTSKISNI